MILFKHRILTAAVATTLSLGITANSHAGALAFSNLSINNFTINNSAGSQYKFSDFATVTIGNSASNTTSLNGAPATSHILGPVAGDLPVPQVCQGTGCPADNTYTPQVTVISPNPVIPIPGILFGRADVDLTGASVSGVPGGVTTPATANQVSEVELNQTGTGNGSTTAGTATQFTFRLASADSITFNGSASGLNQAALAADAINGLSSASFSFSINIKDLSLPGAPTIYVFEPGQLNGIGNLSIASPGSDTFRLNPITLSALALLPGNSSNTSPVLNSTDTYTLTISSHTEAGSRVVEGVVPEPASLALLGVGLLGMGMARRRRKV